MRSFAPVNQDRCAVCGDPVDAFAVLVSSDIADERASQPKTEWGLCRVHQTLYDEGKVALVGREPGVADGVINLDVKQSEATGRLLMVDKDLLARLFKASLPVDEQGRVVPVLYVHPSVIDQFTLMFKKAREEKKPH